MTQGWIYTVTNLINQKKYVGQTVQSPKDRWHRHCSSHPFVTALHSAIRKHGRKNFKFEVIDQADSLEELNEKERVWIEKLGTFRKNGGYNRTPGGLSYERTDDMREKISLKMKGRIINKKCLQSVVCLTTGQRFESQRAACRFFGLHRSAVHDSIKNRRRVGGSRRLIFKKGEMT